MCVQILRCSKWTQTPRYSDVWHKRSIKMVHCATTHRSTSSHWLHRATNPRPYAVQWSFGFASRVHSWFEAVSVLCLASTSTTCCFPTCFNPWIVVHWIQRFLVRFSVVHIYTVMYLRKFPPTLIAVGVNESPGDSPLCSRLNYLICNVKHWTGVHEGGWSFYFLYCSCTATQSCCCAYRQLSSGCFLMPSGHVTEQRWSEINVSTVSTPLLSIEVNLFNAKLKPC